MDGVKSVHGMASALIVACVAVSSLVVPAVAVARAAAWTELAPVFADHMVLPRDEAVVVFGRDSTPGAEVTVAFAGQTKRASVGADGRWRVMLDPLATNASGEELSVTGSATVRLDDVLVGEVWLAAGQSNMDFPVKQCSSKPDPALFGLVRMANWQGTVGTGAGTVYGADEFAKLTASDYYAGTWQTLDGDRVAPQSGVAWFFAAELVRALRGKGPGGPDVPVGVIDVSVGGTCTEAYLPPQLMLADPVLKDCFRKPRNHPALGDWTGPRIDRNLGKYRHLDSAKPHPHPFAPGFLHQAAIARIAPLPVRGVIWYQGESNAEFVNGAVDGPALVDRQLHVLKTLVSSLRADFGKQALPFYQVLLPRIEAPNRKMWPWYREAQLRLAAEVPGVATAVVTEFGEDGDVHPANKEAVGVRLARLARARTYGEQGLEDSGPVPRKRTPLGDRILLEFDHTGDGLVVSDGEPLRHFELAGEDGRFVPATAVIRGRDIVEVHADGLDCPVAVRFAWLMNPDVNLRNRCGDLMISAAPFRTKCGPEPPPGDGQKPSR